MSTLIERLNAVKEHVTRLVQEHDRLRERITVYEREAQEHRRMSDVLNTRISELERENEVLREAAEQAKSLSARPGSKERIDELVAEIDRCLELLNP